MKLVGIISTAVLSMSLGATAPVYAQQEQHDQQKEQQSKPAQQDEKKTQPARQAQKAPQQRNINTKQAQKAPAQPNRNGKQPAVASQQQNNQAKGSAQPQSASRQSTPRQSTQQARSKPQGRPANQNDARRIPDDRFRAKFGQEHRFHISQADYSRNRRFQYGGYWFGFVDPWPSNWLYTQDVFVVDINGVYYLCNSTYPGVNVAINVEL